MKKILFYSHIFQNSNWFSPEKKETKLRWRKILMLCKERLVPSHVDRRLNFRRKSKESKLSYEKWCKLVFEGWLFFMDRVFVFRNRELGSTTFFFLSTTICSRRCCVINLRLKSSKLYRFFVSKLQFLLSQPHVNVTTLNIRFLTWPKLSRTKTTKNFSVPKIINREFKSRRLSLTKWS